jgi:hypothetical protein
MPIKLTIAKINSRLSKTNFQCTEENYRNPNLKMKFKCSAGHLFEATWKNIQTYATRSLHCPLCKHGDDYFFKDMCKNEKNDKETYFYKDKNGHIYKTQREYQKFSRQEKASTNPHEIAVESLHNKIPNSQKYKFRESVFEAFIKWETMSIMKNNEIISQDSTPDNKLLNNELKTIYCTVCEDRAENCSCDEEKTTLYDFLSKSYLNDIIEDITFVPDLFVIDEEKYIITAIEIEDTHRVPVSKLVKYARFQDHADWWKPEWKFYLLICDRFGNEMGYINLPVYYWASIGDNFKDNFIKELEKIEQKASRIEKELMGYYRSTSF